MFGMWQDFFHTLALSAHVKASRSCREAYIACFPPARDEAVCCEQAEDSKLAKDMKSQGWLPTEAFVPPIRVPGPLLPSAGMPGALEMLRKWQIRIGSDSEPGLGLDGFCRDDAASGAPDDLILPFLYQSNGGRDPGRCGVFQYFGLAAEAARLHITSYVFVHFYSGHRRHGDLQHQIDMQANVSGLHLFCISIDLCLAKQHSDLTCPATKAFWISKMRSVTGVGDWWGSQL